MRKDISFHWGQGHLEVNIYTPTDRRSRFVIGLEATVLLGLWAGLFVRQQLLSDALFGAIAVGLAAITGYLVVRAIRRFTFAEKVFVDASHITLIRTTCFSRTVRSFERTGIGPLRYCVPENIILMQPCRPSDLLCDGHSAQLRRALTHAGNLFFDYGGERIYFGKGVYSWHAESLAFYLRLYCGDSLRFGPEWHTLSAETITGFPEKQ